MDHWNVPMRAKINPGLWAYSERGFTLVELMITIIILGILCGIVVPV